MVDGRWSDESLLERIQASDAVIFGSPTYMGMVSGVFKCFADATAPIWFSQSWKDKIAGGFTASAFPSGDKVMTLHYMATLAGQLRMIWVGPDAAASITTSDGRDIDRWGFWIGVGAQGSTAAGSGEVSAGDLLTARLYGMRIAHAATAWNPQPH